ncbi:MULTISPECIES: hypothetical protein [unclassified Bradyrhizobium]|uniref:hypothetical protein n=1 Tax=unclassified Bradyrhizobium TaxID=2631580 RepID=UPI0033941CC9
MSGSGKDDFSRLRAQFSRRANAPDIPALASKLCWWIAYGHMDSKRHTAFVTQKTLANDLGSVAVRTVQRMIDILKPLGLNVAPGHGPDKASTYWIGEANTTSMSPIETDNTTSMSPIHPSQGDTGVRSRRHFKRHKATLVSRHIKNSKKNSKKVSNKSAPPARSSADDGRESGNSISTDGPVARTAHAALNDHLEAQQQPPSRNDQVMGRPAANGADADADAMRWSQFEDVRRNWPRVRVDEGKAHEVFLRVRAAGHSLQAVIDAVGDTLMAEGDVPWLSEALAIIIERDQAHRTSRQ